MDAKLLENMLDASNGDERARKMSNFKETIDKQAK